MKEDDIVELLNQIECGDFEFTLRYKGIVPYLQIQCEDTCNNTGEPYRWNGRKWMLSEHMTASEIVQTAWAAAKFATEHELRETFKWNGQCIFRPHFDIRALHDISKKGYLDIRGEM